ncbi:MBL fold metallo-hydrolase [bacterium]|nr:MBL fold metallo-hydrolase [bacterium]
MKKKIALWSITGLVVLILTGIGIVGWKMQPLLVCKAEPLNEQLQIFIGGGGNSIVLISADKQKVLVVDTKMGMWSKQLKAYCDQVAPDADVMVVNTHYHSDHIKGNVLFPQAQLIAGDYTDTFWQSHAGTRLPDERITVGEETVLVLGEETVHIRNMGQAHTRHDTVVYLEKRKLLVTGDLVFNGWHPAMFETAGSHVDKWILVLDDLIARYAVEILVPGHGPVTDGSGLLKQREYFVSLRDAADDPEKLVQLKKKYKEFFTLPFMTGFEKTLKFIRAEREK